MSDIFDIYVHHLADGHQEKIEEILPPTFLAAQEADIRFTSPISILGEAQLAAEEVLILRLKVETEVSIPCNICNRDIRVKISIPNFYQTEELSNVRVGIFNFKEVLREEILLAIPSTAECSGGDCPGRATISKYFSNNKENDCHPFENW